MLRRCTLRHLPGCNSGRDARAPRLGSGSSHPRRHAVERFVASGADGVLRVPFFDWCREWCVEVGLHCGFVEASANSFVSIGGLCEPIVLASLVARCEARRERRRGR